MKLGKARKRVKGRDNDGQKPWHIGSLEMWYRCIAQ